MKRELKFRITYQHEDTGRITQRIIELGQPIPHLGERWFVIGQDQFTGLKDKNGKEIYEEDIIKTETEKAMQVSWNVHFASFCLDRDGWMFTHYFGEAVDPEQLEVIGNIWENPELLKS